MASVREELIDELVNGDLGCSEKEATKAVDNAIFRHANEEDFGKDIAATADMIYDDQTYWED